MAALIVQSRFAGLKIEDDDQSTSNSVKTQKKKTPATAKKHEPAKKTNKVNAAKPQFPSSAGQNKKKKGKGTVAGKEQWEQWKQKDAEMADGNFENELQQAILLSQLDYEQKKDVYKQLKVEAETEKKIIETSKASGKKNKKKNVMSLDQFNDMVSGEEPKCNHEDEKRSPSPEKDTEFFQRIKDNTKDELLKDKIKDRMKGKPLSDEVISRVQFAEALEKKDIEISAMRQEITSLKAELLTVKCRNKKLCNILGQGEMKDKAEVLVEVERLRGVQAELTGEVAALHGQLERERSRTIDTRPRDKKKKGTNGEKEK